MKNLKLDDVCVITEIGECDSWYAYRDQLVGKKVRFEGYIASPVGLPDFISCCVLFLDTIPGLAIWSGRASCFYCVKLEKIGG
jgi:hypothetical protein